MEEIDYKLFLKNHDVAFEKISAEGRELLNRFKELLEKSSLMSFHNQDDNTFEFSFWNIHYKVEAVIVMIKSKTDKNKLVFEGEINTYTNYQDEDITNIQLVYSTQFDKSGNLKTAYGEISAGYVKDFINTLLKHHVDMRTKIPIRKDGGKS